MPFRRTASRIFRWGFLKQMTVSQNKIERQILLGSEDGGKHYAFDNSHDSSLPAQTWFQESDEGLILFDRGYYWEAHERLEAV